MFIQPPNSGQEPQDIASVMTELNTVNHQFNARHAELSQFLGIWRPGLEADFAGVADRLEARLPFIESGAPFTGLSPNDYARGISDMLSVFRNQKEMATLMQADFPSDPCVRLITVLDKLISSLEQQSKTTRSTSLFMNRSELRSMLGPRSSRMTTAKNWGPFPPTRSTE
ncbi:hypothetical protein IAD21_01213 [Abditibacteriota bacterium]|nr:hypothetical protein IAD21_01213 [Abditibacteriota bacterium]